MMLQKSQTQGNLGRKSIKMQDLKHKLGKSSKKATDTPLDRWKRLTKNLLLHDPKSSKK